MSENTLELLLERLLERELNSSGSAYERHITTIGIGLVTVGIIWIVSSLNGVGQTQSDFRADMEIMKHDMAALRKDINDATKFYVSKEEFTVFKERHNMQIESITRKIKEDEE